MKKGVAVNCKKCNDLINHKFVAEGKVCEVWSCTKCGNERLFGKAGK